MKFYVDDLPGDFFQDREQFKLDLDAIIRGYAQRAKRNFKIRFRVSEFDFKDYAVFPVFKSGNLKTLNYEQLERNKLFVRSARDL